MPLTGSRHYTRRSTYYICKSFRACVLIYLIAVLLVIYCLYHVASGVRLAIIDAIQHSSEVELRRAFEEERTKADDVNVSDASALFRQRPLVVWSQDFHISPIDDLKYLLRPLGVRFLDRSLSAHCRITRTCGSDADLRVVDSENGMDLYDPTLIRRFHEAYRNDAKMASVDAFVCFHPAAMCELFAPFNKSILVIASTRYELGRFGAQRWRRLNENLVRIAADPRNLVAANNRYDAEYIRYFTGIHASLLPSYCGYFAVSYRPSKFGYLLAPVRKSGFEKRFLLEFRGRIQDDEGNSYDATDLDSLLTPLRTLYPNYRYSDLAAHPGIVYIPYQVSVMSLFEQYRMNIPLFFPSIDLLASWQYEHGVMTERTWDVVRGRPPPRGSIIAAHPSQRHRPDPNDDRNLDAIRYWIKYADFYRLPHITYFRSADDLADILRRLQPVDLRQISDSMREHNVRAKRQLRRKWTKILKNVARRSANNPH